MNTLRCFCTTKSDSWSPHRGCNKEPLLFCCALQGLIDKIEALDLTFHKWYLDDGGLVGTSEQLLRAWDLLCDEGPALGLFVNPGKCEWSWLDPACSEECPIVRQASGIQVVPTDEITMLGIPLGSPVFNARYVEYKLNKRTSPVLKKLAQFEDPQAAIYLLRVSNSIVKAGYFMRTTEIQDWSVQARAFDQEVVATAENILAIPLANNVQIRLAPSKGGLGLRRVSDHAPGAFVASWNATRVPDEKWTVPVLCAGKPAQSQAEASQVFDDNLFESVLSSLSEQRSKKHLACINKPHANSWVVALPSWSDGLETIMKPKIFLTAIRRLLSLPVFSTTYTCPFCMQIADSYGDHATCCSRGGSLIVRHNKIRNFLFKIGQDGLLDPVMEKLGLLGSTYHLRRPGDVTCRQWRDGMGLAIDVGICCPLAKSRLRESDSKEVMARVKHRLYDHGFSLQSTYTFGAMIMETSGAVNRTSILKRLFRLGGGGSLTVNTALGHGLACRANFKQVWLKTSSILSLLHLHRITCCYNFFSSEIPSG
jgi:hypothetical protein